MAEPTTPAIQPIELSEELKKLGIEAVIVDAPLKDKQQDQPSVPEQKFKIGDLYVLRTRALGKKEDFASDQDYTNNQMVVDNLIYAFTPQKDSEEEYAAAYVLHMLYMIVVTKKWEGPTILKNYLEITKLASFALVNDVKGEMDPISVFRRYCMKQLDDELMNAVASYVIPLILKDVKYTTVNELTNPDGFATLYKELTEKVGLTVDGPLNSQQDPELTFPKILHNIQIKLLRERLDESATSDAFDVIRSFVKLSKGDQEMDVILDKVCDECRESFYPEKCTHVPSVAASFDTLTPQQTENCRFVVNEIVKSTKRLMIIAKAKGLKDFDRVVEQIFAILMTRGPCRAQPIPSTEKAFLCAFALSGNPRFERIWNQVFPESPLYREDQQGYLLSRVFREIITMEETQRKKLAAELDFELQESETGETFMDKKNASTFLAK